MAIAIRCTKCGAKVRVFSSMLGETFRCIECGKKLRVEDTRKPEPSDPLVGRKFGHYRIEERVGEGAMAVVYRARNLQLDRTVAIKVLSEKAKAAGPAVAERFLAEAKSAARLEHTNVLSVYYAGKQDGLYFIEMQYAEASSLREALIENGPFDERAAARMIRDAARGLAAAHGKGLIHRDVKPANLMLTDDGTVAVSDFGLAKIRDAEKDLTAAGIIVGTPVYMSPEQVTDRPLDERSDIYSLGIVFFELVTGRRPFDADNAIAVLHMHAYKRMPSPRKYAPELPEAVCGIIAKMTRKKRGHRYQDCEDVAKDLDKFLAGDTEISVAVADNDGTESDVAVNKTSLFRTMARYSLASGEPDNERTSGLRQAARELDLPEDDIDRVISEMRTERNASKPTHRPRFMDVGGERDRDTPIRARRYGEGPLAQCFRVAAVVAVCAAVVVGVRWVLSRTPAGQEPTNAREETTGESKTVTRGKSMARLGERHESNGNWKKAIHDYQASLKLREDDEVRKRLTVVTQIAKALELETKGQRREAEKLLAAALPETRGKKYVSKRLEAIRSALSYESTYAEAKKAFADRDWPRAAASFRSAARIAREAGMETDAAALADRAQNVIASADKRRAQIERLIALCKGQKSACALYAACDFYLSTSDGAPLRKKLEKTREEAAAHITAHAGSGPKAPVEEANDLHVVRLKKGDTLQCRLLAKRDNAVELAVLGEKEDVRRLIHVRDIASLDRVTAAEINNLRAEEICADLLTARKDNQAFQALEIIGKLRTEFAESSIVADPERQKAKLGAPLADILARCVSECEQVCAECAGRGSVPCDECGGQGSRIAECRNCLNPKRGPKCPKCAGRGILSIGNCSYCKGSGKMRCNHCRGKGCPYCQGYGSWTCLVCRGTGRRYTKKSCAKCKGVGFVDGNRCAKCDGRGSPLCPVCKGSGRGPCPVCKDTKKVRVPCRKCNATGRIPCVKCRLKTLEQKRQQEQGEPQKQEREPLFPPP